MATTIQIPDFNFSAFYYAQILESLIQYKRREVPELTDESEYEPFIQLLRATALVGHLNNVHLDIVANENTLPTARLQTTVRNMLRLIGYDLAPSSPAQADMLYKLAKVLTATTEAVPYRSAVGTRRSGDLPVVPFEANAALSCDRTDRFTGVYGSDGGVFTDFTALANDHTPGTPWTPWATPASRDALYFGHAQALWTKLHIEAISPPTGIVGIWEYYDGEWMKEAPTSVVDLGGALEFDLTSYLGTSDRRGTAIRVHVNETMTYEDVISTWNGSANIAVTSGYLGQIVPSTDPTRYTIGSQWEALPDEDDGTGGLSTSGDLAYTLPQSQVNDWVPGTVNALSCYWLRYRIITATAPVSPVLDWASLDKGDQYVLGVATQGRSITEDPFGSSTGEPSQRFTTSRDFYLASTMEIQVDDIAWAEVKDFLSSQPNDLHYRVELGDNDRATVVFGDGNAGRVPPAGANNIVATYRYGAEDDGNVGAGTIIVDKTGLSYISSVTNPRPARGWKLSEGATEETLEQAKIAGPMSLRIREVALGPDDVEALTVAYTDEAGSHPFSRARAFEEGFGPKTVELVVVAAGGSTATAEMLAALELYFNGDKFAYPPVPKHLVQNQEAVPINFTPKVIDIVATVYGDVEEESIRNKLALVIHPEARMEDGVTWEWEFGSEVPVSRINHEIFTSDPDIKRVDLTTPSANVPLQPRELPVLGTITLTIVR